MFRIHIVRNRQPIGEFTPEEVSEGLQTGKFLPTDLGWREPMPAWKPLSEFDNLPQVDLSPSSSTTDVPPAMPATESVPATAEPAWERRGSMGIIPALYESVRQIFSTPVFVFQSMPKTGGLKAPLSFYLILGTISMWATVIYQAAAFYINPELMSQMPKSMTPTLIMWSQVFSFVLSPVIVAALAFIMSGMFHFTLKALGIATVSYETTLRAFCYASGAASVMQLIPICGGYIGLATQIVLLVLAFREINKITTWQAAIAVTVPILLCCGLALGGYAAAMGAAIAAGTLK